MLMSSASADRGRQLGSEVLCMQIAWGSATFCSQTAAQALEGCRILDKHALYTHIGRTQMQTPGAGRSVMMRDGEKSNVLIGSHGMGTSLCTRGQRPGVDRRAGPGWRGFEPKVPRGRSTLAHAQREVVRDGDAY